MSVLSDRWIKKMALEKEMINPFISEQKRGRAISYGLSSFGYDARVSNEFKIFTDVDSVIVDPKNFKNNSFVSRKGDECVIPPNSFALASTVEYFKIPKDILVICLGKSTYARCGIRKFKCNMAFPTRFERSNIYNYSTSSICRFA